MRAADRKDDLVMLRGEALGDLEVAKVERLESPKEEAACHCATRLPLGFGGFEKRNPATRRRPRSGEDHPRLGAGPAALAPSMMGFLATAGRRRVRRATRVVFFVLGRRMCSRTSSRVST